MVNDNKTPGEIVSIAVTYIVPTYFVSSDKNNNSNNTNNKKQKNDKNNKGMEGKGYSSKEGLSWKLDKMVSVQLLEIELQL